MKKISSWTVFFKSKNNNVHYILKSRQTRFAIKGFSLRLAISTVKRLCLKRSPPSCRKRSYFEISNFKFGLQEYQQHANLLQAIQGVHNLQDDIPKNNQNFLGQEHLILGEYNRQRHLLQ